MTDSTKMTERTCPACGEGALQARTQAESVEYHGKTSEIALHYALCDHCGAELTGAEDSRHNKRAMNAFKKSVDGLLSGDEIRAFRNRLRLNQKLAAQLLGGGPVAFSRYESDDIVHSAAMDSALRLCIASPSNLLTLAELKDIDLPGKTVERITHNERDQLLFMIRAIREQLDREQAIAGSRPVQRSRSTTESLHGVILHWRKTTHWGSA